MVLSENIVSKSESNSPVTTKRKHKDHANEICEEGKENVGIQSKKRRRPNAAVRERERLKVFNDALDNLQDVIPVRLPAGRKLHKKQTLQLAMRYIEFLRGCLEGRHDWNDRSRFLWCSGSQQEDFITAIDAAAAASSSTHMQEKYDQSVWTSSPTGSIESRSSSMDCSYDCTDHSQFASPDSAEFLIHSVPKESLVDFSTGGMLTFDSYLEPITETILKSREMTSVTTVTYCYDVHDLDEVLNDLEEITMEFFPFTKPDETIKSEH